MLKNTMIEYIDVLKIKPHPSNPRQDLGDLTELAASIKVNGVLQNLTVVPTKGALEIDDFTVVVGHRRLAAAKLAGLTEVPCVVSYMGRKQQVATMLLENLQRSDLTIFEQAQGFQMMLDFGETIPEISKQTGFSDTTIRRRVKLMELDQNKLRKSMERGATLMDYAELDKIKDPELKNKVLDTIGTADFRNALQRALADERTKENIAKLVEQLEQFATQITQDECHEMKYVTSYITSEERKVNFPDDDAEYFFYASKYHVSLYTKKEHAPDDTARAEAVETMDKELELKAALKGITERALKLRRDFIRGISNWKAAKNISTIIQMAIQVMLEVYSSGDPQSFAEFLGDDAGIGEAHEFKDIASFVKQQPERSLLVATYLAFDSGHTAYHTWDGRHRENGTLDTVYDFLAKLGYEISKEEQAMRDGTHELFKP